MKGNYGDKPFRGIYPALLTPISEDGKIKKEGLKKDVYKRQLFMLKKK